MIRFFCLFALVFFPFFAKAEHLIDSLPLSNTDGGCSTIAAGCVNVITGDYIENATDLSMPGPEMLEINRSWGSSSGWIFNFLSSVHYDQKNEEMRAHFRETSGRIASYEGKIKEFGNQYSLTRFNIRKDGKGSTNIGEGAVSGKTNIKNTQVFFRRIKDEKKKKIHIDAKVEKGDGTWLYFQNAFSKHYVKLTKEEKPNGNKFCYTYHNDSTTKSIQATNRSENKIYSSLHYIFPGINEKKQGKGRYNFYADSSDGGHVTYCIEVIDRAETLKRVDSTSRPAVDYAYEKQKRLNGYNMVSKKLPDGRFTKLVYFVPHGGFEKNFWIDRVREVQSPAGVDSKPVVTHTFAYQARQKIDEDGVAETFEGSTDVTDANGVLTTYRYDAYHRLSEIEKFTGRSKDSYKTYTKERFAWGVKCWRDEGNLISRRIDAHDDSTLALRIFAYDERGNIVDETFYGNLSGRGKSLPPGFWSHPEDSGAEYERKKYTYTQDAKGCQRNLMLSLEESNGKSLNFSYKGLTDLLETKLVKDGEKIVERHFYEYDDTATLIKEIKDDGCSPDKNDLSGVTERHITYITPRGSYPFGAAAVKEEKALDLKTGEEKLLHKTVYEYSSNGKKILEEHYDAEGAYCYSLKWEYDGHGNVIKETNALGQMIERRFDANDNLIFEQGPSPFHYKNFTYDFCNRLIKEEVVSSSGEILTTSYRYNVMSQKVAEIDTYGNETTFVYDEFGRVIEKHHPAFFNENEELVFPVSKTEYDSFGYPTKLEDQMGHVTEISYNVRGKPVDICYPDGSKESFTYNLDGTLKESVAKNGAVTKYLHDVFGRLLQKEIYAADGTFLSKTSSTYSAFHETSSTDSEGNTTYYSYDFAGRLLSSVKGKSKTRYAYDSLGRIYKVFEQYGEDQNACKVTVKLYDFLNRVIEERVEEANGEVLSRTGFEYDYNGNIARKIEYGSDGALSTYTEYNFLKQPVKIIDPSGEERNFHYNYSLRNRFGETVLEITEVDPLGNKTISEMNPLQKEGVVVKKNAVGRTVSKKECFYNSSGLKTTEVHTVVCEGKPERKIVNAWHYNVMGEVVCQIEALGAPEQKSICYEYNAFGQKQALVKPDGTRIFYFYDALGRLEAFKASNHSFWYSYVYDLNGNPKEIIDEIAKEKSYRSYDEHGNVIAETLPGGFKTSYFYDGRNRPVKVVLPDGSETRYFYNASRLKKIQRIDKAGSIAWEHQDLEHDSSGRVLKAKLASGALVEYLYDPCGRLRQVLSFEREEKIGYDAVGNLLEAVVDGEKSSYAYDDLYQLKSENGPFKHIYECDSLYNCLVKDGHEQSFNSLNQLLSDAKGSYIYDENGNLTKKESRQEACCFSYDALDRLVSFTKGDQRFEYTYDAFNRRLSKKRFDKGKLACQEFYLYQGQNEVGTIKPSGRIASLRVLGVGKGAEIGASIAFEFENELFVPMHDYRGNVALLLDSSGVVKERYCYGAFGEEAIFDEGGESMIESSVCNSWRFSSKRKDAETGFIYFGRRYYDPSTSRWATKDPIGFEGGPNLYAYVMNSPLTHFDLYGLYALARPFSYGRLPGGVASALHSALSCLSSSFKRVGSGIHLFGEHLLPIPIVRDIPSFIGHQMANLGKPWTCDFRKPHSQILPPSEGISHSQKMQVLEVPGILTEKPFFQETMKGVSEIFQGQVIRGIYNATHGLLTDLGECLAQHIGIPTNSVAKLVAQIKQSCLEVGDDGIVYLLAHSQGGLITHRALSQLKPEEKQKLRIYTFGSAKIIDDNDVGYAKNFVSTRDAVPFISDPIGCLKGAFSKTSNVEFLKSNEIPFIDHAFASPTYQGALHRVANEFNRQYVW